MNALLSSGSEASLEFVLICCIIFISIENLQGRSAEAIRHLQAGCQLIKLLRCAKGSRVMGRGDAQGLLSAAMDMLYRFGQYLGIYVGVDIFSDLDFSTPIVDVGHPDSPFTSSAEAAAVFRGIDRLFYTLLYQRQLPAALDNLLIISNAESSVESSGLGTSSSPHTRTSAKIVVKSAFDVWKQRFQPLSRLSEDALGPQEYRHTAALRLHEAAWDVLTGALSNTTPFAVEGCAEVLDRAEALLLLDADRKYAHFTFDGDVLWAISYICRGSLDVTIQTRCLGLLRSVNRREGVWDSRDLAAVCEATIAALEHGTILWEDLPRELSRLL
ncbi:hypothetical protein FALCPG4_017214 [Fusarium falciforme]